MTKIRIEVCIISARGLGGSTSLLKPQWLAVGWIDPNSKYCTKIYSSGNPNPTWKTKFLFDVDDRSSNMQDLSLTIEIHKREPIFLRDKLHGIANIMLKEFLVKFLKDTDTFRSGLEEVGSFQLRKQNSGRPQGFVDISVRISEERDGVSSHSGRNGFHSTDQRTKIALAIEDSLVLSYPTQSQP
ncbi:uncharacterized protein LOC110113562 isoform X1 [Dendrobium catenatum]|uniref:uncharacterized protein LOC110113562 isoform X1 n=1 Tax=Dendrobium catenatum TaxID=906689 RepID=UPI0009F30C44|nr:uncharacterized protein LOC110113562 isoform X1 [Dendrobium catenatum]